MRSRGSNDLVTIFKDLRNTTSWSCAASRCIKSICDLSDFYSEAIEIGTNGMLPRANLREALVQLNREVSNDDPNTYPFRWNFAARSDCDAATDLSGTIRAGLRKLRDCKESSTAYSRALHQANDSTTTTLDALLDGIDLQNTAAAEHFVFSAVCSDVDKGGLSTVFDRCLAPEFDFAPTSVACPTTDDLHHRRGLRFIMDQDTDSEIEFDSFGQRIARTPRDNHAVTGPVIKHESLATPPSKSLVDTKPH